MKKILISIGGLIMFIASMIILSSLSCDEVLDNDDNDDDYDEEYDCIDIE